MSTHRPPPSPLPVRGVRLLFIAACLVVVIAGLRAAHGVLLPLLMALFLAVLCGPPTRWLHRRGLPEWAAVALVMTVATLSVLGVAVLIGGTIQRFYLELPLYRARLDAMVQAGLAWLASRGIDVSAEELSARMDAGALMELAGATAASVVSAFSGLVLILVLTGFMLAEASGAPSKLRRALGDPAAGLDRIRRGTDQVQRYLAVKALMSLLNAGVAMVICFALDVDFAPLWGLFAFLLNFIPNIGSILSGIAPALLALVTHGPARAALVAALYLSIDFVSGNVIEPRLMGRRLGLSPLAVMLSLVFWGWLWGPVGMLLAVPLTSSLKIFLEHTEFDWVAVLLGADTPPADATE